MVDTLATIIAYLRRDADLRTLVSDRIAVKHKFAMGLQGAGTLRGWPTPSKAITLIYDPGALPDLAAHCAQQRARLEVRCYGESQIEASRVYNDLIRVTRAFVRTTVPLEHGIQALLYWLYPDTSGQTDYDADVNVDFLRVFLRASTAPEAIATS